jgi:hypothetical protein
MATTAATAGSHCGRSRRLAEFRISNGLERGADLARFLNANDLSADGFERLVVADELLRWAWLPTRGLAGSPTSRRSARLSGLNIGMYASDDGSNRRPRARPVRRPRPGHL